MFGLVDTHAHLQDKAFADDFDVVMARIRECRPAAVINAGTDLETSRQAVEMAEKEPNFWALAGFTRMTQKNGMPLRSPNSGSCSLIRARQASARSDSIIITTFRRKMCKKRCF